MMAKIESFKSVPTKMLGGVDIMTEGQAVALSLPYKFNPSFLTDDEAIESFVVRKGEFARILETLVDCRDAPKNRHILISAPRGAGKTTLVRRVLAEIRTNQSFASSWYPLILGEESYSITTPGEFFLECLFHLQDQIQEERWRDRYVEAQDQTTEADLLRVSIDALRDFAFEQHKKILLIVENVHMIFGEQIGKESSSLKKILENEVCFMLLATSVKSTETDPDDPSTAIFKDFEPIPLFPLDLGECQKLWSSLTGQVVRTERIRPIQILTGGSPRLMRIMAEFTVSPSLQNLMENLNQLIDQNTEYFKSQLDNLPPTERKVFAALLDNWDPSTAKQVADSSRVNVNVASAMLGRLADRGSVIKLPGKGRAVTYHAAERLFNIYYLMRRRNHPSSRVRALVAFMTQYYRTDELIDTTAKLVAEACLLDPLRRQEYHSAFSAIIAQSSGEIRQKILAQTPEDFLSPIMNSEEFRSAVAASRHQRDTERRTGVQSKVRSSRKLTALLKRVRATAEEQPEAAESMLREAISGDEHSSQLWLELSILLSREGGRESEAIAAAQRATELERSSTAHAILGSLLVESDGDPKQAEQNLLEALALDPENVIALSSLGDLKHQQDNFEEAAKLYSRAWQNAPDLESALIDLASVVGPHLERNKEAEALLREGLAAHPDWRRTRRMLAQCLYIMGRGEEGEEILRQGIECDPKSPQRLFDLALFLLRQLRKGSEAVRLLETVTELEPEQSFIWEIYAEALQAEGTNLSAALGAAEKAAKLDPTSVSAMLRVAETHVSLENFDQAEAIYRKSTELPDAGFYVWYEFGRFLQRLPGRIDEAEAALRKAVAESDRSTCVASKELAALLVHKGKDDEAIPLLQDAVRINPDCYCSLTLNGGIATRRGDAETARKLFGRALEINPKGVTALTSLAQVAIELENDPSDAETWVSKAVAASPQDARVFLARALVRRAQGAIADCIDDLRLSLEISPRFNEAKLMLARVVAEHRDPALAVSLVGEVLTGLERRRELLSGVIDVTIVLAQRGHANEVRDEIERRNVQELLEPLLVALDIFQGLSPVKAKEVMEVAQDIAARMGVPENERR